MIKHARALFMVVLAIIVAIVIPEGLCAEHNLAPWWVWPSCTEMDEIALRALLTFISWVAIAIAVLIEREDW